jgi:hypothetical protein
MLDEAEIVSRLALDNMKFHQLQIIEGTPMAQEYVQDPQAFNLFSWKEYLDFIIDFLERLNPAFVVERMTGEAPPRYIAGPRWGKKRSDQILQLIEHRMEERGAYQGRLYAP